MPARKIRTISRRSTAEERDRHAKFRALVEQERAEIVARGRDELRRLVPVHRAVSDLKAAREAAGVSLAEMQQRTGIDKGNLSRLENGLAPNPTVETLTRYAAALGQELVLSLQPMAESAAK